MMLMPLPSKAKVFSTFTCPIVLLSCFYCTILLLIDQFLGYMVGFNVVALIRIVLNWQCYYGNFYLLWACLTNLRARCQKTVIYLLLSSSVALKTSALSLGSVSGARVNWEHYAVLRLLFQLNDFLFIQISTL